VRVADHHRFDLALAGEEDPDLAAQVGGDPGEVPGELEGDDVLGGDAPAVGPLEGASLGGLDAVRVAFDLRDGSLLLAVDGPGAGTTLYPGVRER
jgi:hypothetical protein